MTVQLLKYYKKLFGENLGGEHLVWLLKWYWRPTDLLLSSNLIFSQMVAIQIHVDYSPFKKKFWPAKQKKWTLPPNFWLLTPFKKILGSPKEKEKKKKNCPPPQQFLWTPSKQKSWKRKKKNQRFSISCIKNCWEDPVGSDPNLREYMRIKESDLKWNLVYKIKKIHKG